MGLRRYLPIQYRVRPGREYKPRPAKPPAASAESTPAEADRQARQQARRERKTFYDSPAWRRLAAAVRKDERVCRVCKAELGKLTPAECVDHIIPLALRPDLALDRENLQALCWECHSRKTREENQGGDNLTR